jgi:hypothetical protein
VDVALPSPPDAPAALVPSALLFGRRVAAVRRDLGMSRAEFARAGLSRLESGLATPSFYVLMRLGQQV